LESGRRAQRVDAGDPAVLASEGGRRGSLGFGIEPSAGAEWGHDLSRAVSDASAGIWWTGLYPGIAIVLIVVGVTLVGESLNDVLNPLLRTAKVKQVVLPERTEAP
jgi:peptide/nickel transport system permease protein